ncbi:hypothetical protein GE061_015178 [Apolygus lucorum]|uniref:Uncharacterized protein n=1 Tax=Apolygus lucorum TaxID=248454 RepID=A0A8S9XMB3_APOLU|nr:hypothetical protein GE061_015178 [Apolygus lucorum]
MTMSRVAPAGVPTGRPRKTNRKIPLGVMGRHHLNTIEKTLKTDPVNFIHSLPLIPTTRTSFLPESRDALKKPSAPTFDQPELPFKQKLSTRAKETIMKWKNDLPSPPSFLTSWASKFLAFASRTKTSST